MKSNLCNQQQAHKPQFLAIFDGVNFGEVVSTMILCSDPRNTSTSKLDTEDRYQNEAPKWRSLSLKVNDFFG